MILILILILIILYFVVFIKFLLLANISRKILTLLIDVDWIKFPPLKWVQFQRIVNAERLTDGRGFLVGHLSLVYDSMFELSGGDQFLNKPHRRHANRPLLPPSNLHDFLKSQPIVEGEIHR